MNTGLEELLTEMNSVKDTHQNFSCGRNAQGSTQSKSSRNVEPPGIPEEEFQMILVSEEVEKQLTDNEEDEQTGDGNATPLVVQAVPTVTEEVSCARLNMIPPMLCDDLITNQLSGDLSDNT